MAMSSLKAVKLDQNSDCSTETQFFCQKIRIEACKKELFLETIFSLHKR